MKKSLFLLMAMTISIAASAEPISRQQAQQRAAAFLKQQNPQSTLLTTAIAKAPRKVNGQAVGDQAYYYVFNTEGNHGFVIASGDDVAIPILAYSNEGTFDEENIPDGLQYMLDGYAKEIAWAQENGISATAPRKAPEGRTSISHLVNAKWGQESPYYNQCPKYGISYCLTGCVATAMAQVLYYWANQKDYSNTMGSAAIPEYTTATRKLSVTALSAKMPFDWSYMTATQPTTTNEKNAVATLMRYCGQSVQMDYNTSGSGAYNSDIPYALKNYFFFSRGARYLDRASYTDEEWDEILYNELAEGRPVIYGGVTSSNSGHCFICDGYDSSTGKYYFNWGWSGSSDNTACALSALNTTNGNFNYYHDAIVGIKPIQLETAEDVELASNLTNACLYLKGDRLLTRDARSKDASKAEFMGILMNNSGMDLDMETAFMVFNEDGEYIGVAGEGYRSIEAQAGDYNLESIELGAEMPYGKYKCYLACRTEGSTTWKLMEGAEDCGVEIELASNGTDVIVRPAYGLTIVPSQTKSGSKYTTTLTITNVGWNTYNGTLYVITDGNTSTYKTLDVSNLAPDATTTETITYNYDISSTSHTLLITENYLGLPFYTNAGTGNLYFENFYWQNKVGNNLIGDTYSGVLQVGNYGTGTYTGTVTAKLYEQGAAETSGKAKTFNISVNSGQAKDIKIEFDNVTYGKTYCLKTSFGNYNLYFGASGTSDSSTGTYYLPDYALTPAKGFSVLSEENGLERYLDTDEFAGVPDSTYYVDARYSDKAASLSGGRTNTIFLLKEGTTRPEALAGRNVVIGSTAETITISDDEELYTPADFTAQNITYKRTFDAGCDAETANWSTLMLPFDVQSISCGEQTLDWYRSSEDADKNFWLMDFTSESNGEAQFTYAESLQANHPYLITVPTNAWGEKWNLVGKELTFSGQNAEFKADMPKGVVDRGGKYDFIGRTYLTGQADKYVMNEAGSEFEFVSDGWMFYAFPFRGYFVAYYDLGEESNVVLSMPAPTPTAATAMPGDINRDNSLTIADVTALVNIILSKATDEDNYDLEAANVDGDEVISVADVNALVNLILEKNSDNSAKPSLAKANVLAKADSQKAAARMIASSNSKMLGTDLRLPKGTHAENSKKIMVGNRKSDIQKLK